MQKMKTYTKFKIDENTYRWRDERGYWYIYSYSSISPGFRQVSEMLNHLLERRYQELTAHVPDWESEDDMISKPAFPAFLKDKGSNLESDMNLDCNVQGDESLQEATRTEPEYWVSRDRERLYKIDNQSHWVSKRISFGTWGDWGNCSELPNSIRRICLKADSAGAVLTEQPTRPSEDDMMVKSVVKCVTCNNPIQSPKGLPEPMQAVCKICAKPTISKTNPHVSDIGLRVDRHGNVVFKPELVE